MSSFSLSLIGGVILFMNLLCNVSNAGCPFAAMMNNYNFSGDWSYNLSKDGTEAYVMHICHFANHELYFTLAKNDTPHALIGFGSGNWSQTNMMVGAHVFKINNGSTPSHGLGIGMNMELHQWWYQDPFVSNALDEGTKELRTQTCAVPFGRDIRHEYFRDFWDQKRKFHRNQRIEKRKRDRAKRAKEREEKKKPVYVKYYERFLHFIGYDEVEQNDTVSDEIINAKFAYEKAPNFPTLFGETWTNDEGLSVSFVDEQNGCFNGELLSNISIAYYGVAINSFIEKENGIKNGQFFVKVDENQLMGSSVTFKLNDDGEIVEDEIKGFTMRKAETFVGCKGEQSKTCDDSTKCEL